MWKLPEKAWSAWTCSSDQLKRSLNQSQGIFFWPCFLSCVIISIFIISSFILKFWSSCFLFHFASLPVFMSFFPPPGRLFRPWFVPPVPGYRPFLVPFVILDFSLLLSADFSVSFARIWLISSSLVFLAHVRQLILAGRRAKSHVTIAHQMPLPPLPAEWQINIYLKLDIIVSTITRTIWDWNPRGGGGVRDL